MKNIKMKKIRKMFPILKTKMNGKPLIYFDNSATTQKPWFIIDAISEFYEKTNSNIHRSLNPLSEQATLQYEESRKKIAKFIGGAPSETIFTSGTTNGINLVVNSYAKKFLQKGDRVVLTITEHHSNIVPWLKLKKEIGIEIEYITLKDGKLDIELATTLIKNEKTKFVSIQMVSNVLGIIHDYKKIIELTKEQNVVILLDGAQAMTHIDFSVNELNCDFLVFSGHKMFGPTGIGILWGKKKLLEEMDEWQCGGEMIKSVKKDSYIIEDTPYKFEAGTQNIEGAIVLGKAIDFLTVIKRGENLIEYERYEKTITEYLLYKLSQLNFIEVYGDTNIKNKIPTIAFNIKDIHSHDVGDLLGSFGIAVRAGHHCAEPLHDFLQVQATVRISLCFYNTIEEIDIFIEALNQIYKKFKK